MHTLFGAGTTGGLSDRQLLELFADGRDRSAESAFEALVERHGPMVLRVCHIALNDRTAAQDAFQTTFLILVRRHRSIRRLESIGSWLFGVASRVAARARVDAARRRAAEERWGLRLARVGDADESTSDHADYGPAVQQEVERLPEKYRAVVLLCYWEGLTHEQAADRLVCPLGTVRSRAARARKLLHRRLSRRGLESLAGLAAVWDSPAAEAARTTAVPSSLIGSTVQAAAHVRAGRSMIDVVSPAVAALFREVTRSMFMTKLKVSLAIAVLMGTSVIGAALAAQQAGGRRRALPPPRPTEAEAVKSKGQPALKPYVEYVVEPPDLVIVEVLEALPGRPISGERLVRPDGKIALGFYGELYVAGLTLSEIKEKIVLHLQKFLSDETLGLIRVDPETGEPELDEKTKHPVLISPRDTDRVFVDVTAYNSKHFFVQGAVLEPGRMVVTGNDRVLDAINYAGGLTADADHQHVVLYRLDEKGAAPKAVAIDVDKLMLGDDLSTNYQLQPGDRLVVPFRPGTKPATEPVASSPRPTRVPPGTAGELYFNRQLGPVPKSADGESATPKTRGESMAIRALERRIEAMERKLDLILEAVQKSPR
jgi:RNA polymerase sigma factor (sigma-70 family)